MINWSLAVCLTCSWIRRLFILSLSPWSPKDLIIIFTHMFWLTLLRFLIKQCDLLDFYSYGLYRSNTVSSNPNLLYIVPRYKIYNFFAFHYIIVLLNIINMYHNAFLFAFIHAIAHACTKPTACMLIYTVYFYLLRSMTLAKCCHNTIKCLHNTSVKRWHL